MRCRLSDRRGSGAAGEGARARRSRADRERHPRGGGAGGVGRGDARRGRAALAGLRELRRVQGLRGARRPLPRAGGGTRMSTPTKRNAAAPPIEYSLLLTATLCLLAFGAVMVFSASSARSL